MELGIAALSLQGIVMLLSQGIKKKYAISPVLVGLILLLGLDWVKTGLICAGKVQNFVHDSVGLMAAIIYRAEAKFEAMRQDVLEIKVRRILCPILNLKRLEALRTANLGQIDGVLVNLWLKGCVFSIFLFSLGKYTVLVMI